MPYISHWFLLLLFLRPSCTILPSPCLPQCTAEEYGFSIDCDDGDAILATLPLLEANNCAEDCSSEACRTNFLIMQTHHDHCRHSLVPDPVKDGIHFYEDACEECYSKYMTKLCVRIWEGCAE